MTTLTKRVKFSFQEERLLIPITAAGKVTALLAEATLRFRSQRLLSKDDSFIQIRTSDGYIISPNDSVEDVIQANDQLVLVNKEAWVSEFKRSAQPQYWFGFRAYDHTASLSRDMSVSYASSKSAICITFRKGDVSSMEVFDRELLTTYGKDGEILVMNESGTLDGVHFDQSALFKIQNATVTSIILKCKTLSDPQARISEWPITISETEITCGTECKIQGNWPAAPSKDYVLPPTVRTGKLLESDTPHPRRDLLADPNISTGSSPLLYTQTAHMMPEKYVDQAKTYQHLRVEFSVNNNNTLDTSIARIAAEYQKQDGTWVPVSEISRGTRQNDYNWNLRESATDPFFVPARGIVKFAVSCRIDMPGQKSLETRPRIVDLSLPVPLNVRYTFTDQDQKSSTICVVLNQRGLELPTLDSMKQNNANIQKYFFVDDLTCGERLGAYYVLSSSDNYVRIAPDSSYQTIDGNALHTFTINALKNKTPEVELSNFSRHTYNASVHLLIDLELKYAYGVRVRLSTPDGSLDESFALPKELW